MILYWVLRRTLSHVTFSQLKSSCFCLTAAAGFVVFISGVHAQLSDPVTPEPGCSPTRFSPAVLRVPSLWAQTASSVHFSSRIRHSSAVWRFLAGCVQVTGSFCGTLLLFCWTDGSLLPKRRICVHSLLKWGQRQINWFAEKNNSWKIWELSRSVCCGVLLSYLEQSLRCILLQQGVKKNSVYTFILGHNSVLIPVRGRVVLLNN